MYSDVTGIILVKDENNIESNKNNRLTIVELSIVEHIKNLMTDLFDRVILIANIQKEYKFLELEMFEEFFKGRGTLAGIHAGLFHTETKINFILSVDYPLISSELIKYIVEYETEKLITLPKSEGNIFELAGRYDRKCIVEAEEILKKNINDEKHSNKKNPPEVVSLIDKVQAQLIAAESLPFYSPTIFFTLEEILAKK